MPSGRRRVPANPYRRLIQRRNAILQRFIFIFCLTAFIATTSVFAHQMEDVVYLKNGEIVRGTIIEQIPGESLEIQTQDGSVFVYDLDEIAKIAKEPVTGTEEAPSGIEIGTLFGLSHLSSGIYGGTWIGVPAPTWNIIGNSSLYISWFPSEKLSIGPEFSFGSTSYSYDSSTFSTLYLGGRGAFFPQGNAMSGLYLLGHSAMLLVGEDKDDFEGHFFAGAGLGYQWRVGPAFVLRAEGRYRRWFDDEVNEFSLMLGLGTRLGGR